jgi:AcrR family transcriptional regulator
MPEKTAQKPAPVTPTTDRAEGTRRHILDAAARAFAEHGYRGISLNDIVRDSGLTKGAFYFHFPSKEALALEVFRDKQEKWVARTMAALLERPRAIDQLDAMLDVGCDVYEQDASARVVGRMCVELASQKELTPHLVAHLGHWFDMTEQLIRRAQDEGDVRPEIDARLTAETIVAAFIGIEQVSDELTGLADFRQRVEGLRALAFGAIRTTRSNDERT